MQWNSLDGMPQSFNVLNTLLELTARRQFDRLPNLGRKSAIKEALLWAETV